MTNKNIPALTAATTPLVGTELVPIWDGAATKKASVDNLTTGRNVPMNYAALVNGFTIKTGGVNRWLVQKDGTDDFYIYRYNDAGAYAGNPLRINRANGEIAVENGIAPASGYGINFAAVAGAAGMTSKVLTNYEEGTWTPNQGAGLTVVGAFSSAGTYTRIGRKVTVCGSVTGATSVATTAGGLAITGLPFSMGASPGSGTMFSSSLTAFGVLAVSGTSIYAMNAISGGTISFTITYEV